ncbi:hypothetical protein AB0B97_00230 [Micromonospora sp. NPDC049004]|uniref:hypothetical protein n=1 Tax=Micromonospora sp. NPDC049004 TaxID=3154348 RepID=UPI0033DF55BF
MAADWMMTVASAGGSALAGAVATDVWSAARDGLGKLFGRGGGHRAELARRWADETAVTIEEADDRLTAAEREAQTWQQRLADLLEEFPEAVEELREWAELVRKRLPTAQQSFVNTFVARDSSTQYNAPGGSMAIHHHQPGGGPAK